MSSISRPRGRPKGSRTRTRTQDEGQNKAMGKKRKVDGADDEVQQGKDLELRANAESKSFTNRMLPGYNKRLPEAAQDLVEKALLDHDLAQAGADDPRWVKLYDELQQLVEEGQTSTLSDHTSAAAVGVDDEDDRVVDEDHYQWAASSPSSSSSSSDDPSASQPRSNDEHDPDTRPRAASLLPNTSLTQAVHATVSHSLTNKRGALPKDVSAESWSPASLAALSMVVEEVARSQARFNAQRTMFAKSPRNQELARRREEKKSKEGA